MTSSRRDLYAGGLCLVFGAATAAEAWRYPVGTLREVGPGLFPLAMGVLLGGVGVLIAAGGLAAANREDDAAGSPDGARRPEWVGWFCIVAGVATFIALARPAGLITAGFVSTFVWATGDRQATWRGALALAAAIATFGGLLFGVLLGVSLPLWPTGWGP